MRGAKEDISARGFGHAWSIFFKMWILPSFAWAKATEGLTYIDADFVYNVTNAKAAGVPGIAPHDLRRSCAKMCRAAGGELEQIQLLLGHASVQTTERYLGTKQDLVHAPNDGIKLKVAV